MLRTNRVAVRACGWSSAGATSSWIGTSGSRHSEMRLPVTTWLYGGLLNAVPVSRGRPSWATPLLVTLMRRKLNRGGSRGRGVVGGNGAGLEATEWQGEP